MRVRIDKARRCVQKRRWDGVPRPGTGGPYDSFDYLIAYKTCRAYDLLPREIGLTMREMTSG